MIEKIYENAIFELGPIEKEIDKIEDKIFTGQEKEVVRKISLVNRKLIDFKKNLRSHDETWLVFFNLAEDFFNDSDVLQSLETIMLSYRKTMDSSNQLTELLMDLKDTNNSLLQEKRNQFSKDFTLIAFLTLPITLFVSIISVPTKQTHFLGTDNDFYIVITISLILFILSLMVAR